MKIGLCTSVQQADIAAKTGFDYVEENVQNFLLAEAPDDRFAPMLKAAQNAPLPVAAANCFLPGALKCTGPAADLERIARYAGMTFRRAREVGMRFIVFGSGGSRQVPDGFDHAQAREQFLACLRRIAPLAGEQGIIIVIEPLNSKECNFINSLADGATLVEATNHPHVRLLADFYHMLKEGEDPNEIVVHGKWIQHVHVAEKEGRLAPGNSGEDFAPFLWALKRIDYKGAISYECGWKQFPEQAAGSLKGFRESVRQAGLIS
jgi:sugar phosphate isomerase/epimerase